MRKFLCCRDNFAEKQAWQKAALDWALKAQAEARIVDGVDKKDLTHLGKADIPYYILTTLYATELKERKEGLSRLNMQMQRFNNDF